MHYLYKITNQLNQKCYIGQTVNVRARWYAHKRDSTKSNPPQHIHRAIAKHGIENFMFEVIAVSFDQNAANDAEFELINLHDSVNSGYNMALGGCNAPKTEEWKQKVSQVQKEKWKSGEVTSFWDKLSEEERQLRAAKCAKRMAGTTNKGVPGNKFAEAIVHTDEWKQNHSQYMKAHPELFPPKQTGNQWNLGHKHSEEVNKKKGRKGGNSGSFKLGQSMPAYHKGKTWKLIDGKRIWTTKENN